MTAPSEKWTESEHLLVGVGGSYRVCKCVEMVFIHLKFEKCGHKGVQNKEKISKLYSSFYMVVGFTDGTMLHLPFEKLVTNSSTCKMKVEFMRNELDTFRVLQLQPALDDQ